MIKNTNVLSLRIPVMRDETLLRFNRSKGKASALKVSQNFLICIILYILILITSLFLLTGCKKKEQDITKAPQVDSTAIKDSLARLEEERLKMTYHYFPDSGKIRYADLKEVFSEEERKIILGINRLDARNFGKRDSVVIPDTFANDLLRYTPFPRRLSVAESVKKLILFSYPIQSYAAYEYGNLVRWGPTSLGKRSTLTPTGLYHTNWKAKETISTIDSSWILPWAFNLDNHEGVSMHEFDLPGYPASHACCRLWSADAEWFYYWAEQWILTKDQEDIIAYGTPVIIYGKYNFGHKPPWHYLPQSQDTTKISKEDLASIVGEYIPTILERQTIRDSVVAERERIKAMEEEKKKLSIGKSQAKK